MLMRKMQAAFGNTLLYLTAKKKSPSRINEKMSTKKEVLIDVSIILKNKEIRFFKDPPQKALPALPRSIALFFKVK